MRAISSIAWWLPFVGETTWLVLAYLLMGVGTLVSHGHYSHTAILLQLGGFLALLTAALLHFRSPRSVRRQWIPQQLAGGVILFCLAGCLDQPGIYLHDEAYAPVYWGSALAVAAAVAVAYLVTPHRTRWQQIVFLGAVAVGLGLRLWLPFASPAPIIDVFAQFQESARHLLAGLNPYLTPTSDVYQGQRHFGYTLLGYAYPPGNLYPHTVAYLLGGDIRYGYILCEALALWVLYRLFRRHRDQRIPQLLVLLFLFHPRGIFVIEQAWTEPLLIGAFAVFVWLRERAPQRLAGAAVAFGYFLSLKQYLLFHAVQYLILERRRRAWAIALGTAFATLVPFLVWDADSLLRYGLFFQFGTGFREDGLTLSAVLYRWFGIGLNKWVAISVGSAMTWFTFQRFRDRGMLGFLYATNLTAFAMFLVGSQAFCNYYYFLGVTLLFQLAYRLRIPARVTDTVEVRRPLPTPSLAPASVSDRLVAAN